jgi:hypothetical protein
MDDLKTIEASTTLETREYHEVRNEMRTGDVIVFGGKSVISKMTMWLSKSNVSHAAVVVQTRLRDAKDVDFDNLIVESTKRGGYYGVIVSPASEVIKRYEGNVWWLPLQQRPEFRNNIELTNFLYRDPKDTENRSAFDFRGGFLALSDQFDRTTNWLRGLTHSPEALNKLFCSELVAHALERVEILRVDNASEVSPIDLCRLRLYKSVYYQLKGETQVIKGFNGGAPEAKRIPHRVILSAREHRVAKLAPKQLVSGRRQQLGPGPR